MFNGVDLEQLDIGDCLVLVDIQNDFLKNGTLAVPHSNHILPTVHYWMKRFWIDGLPIIATSDWHPANHCSFKEQGGLWEPHCVIGTEGALLHKSITDLAEKLGIGIEMFIKGQYSHIDSYSGFNIQSTEPYGEDAYSILDEWLQEHDVCRLIVVGLATDYCVKHTVLDAMLFAEYQVVVLTQGIAGVGIEENDVPLALGEMVYSGATLL